MTRSRSLYPRVSILLVMLIALAGVVLSVLSLEIHLEHKAGMHQGPSFCSINEALNCDSVIASEWSEFFGISLGTYGLFFYFSMGLLSLVLPQKGKRGGDILFVLSLIAGIISIILYFISNFYIGALCPLCLGIYAVNCLLLIVTYFAGYSDGLVTRLIDGSALLLKSPILFFQLWLSGNRDNKKFVARVYGAVIIAFILSYSATPLLLVKSSFEMAQKAVRPKKQQSAVERHKPVLQEKPGSEWPTTAAVPATFDRSGSAFADYYSGTLDARVYLVEYIDIECPACRQFYFDLKQVLAPFKKDVAIIVKHYPLDMNCHSSLRQQIHPHACMAAELSRCGGEQEQFFPVFEFLMQYRGLEIKMETAVLLEELYTELGRHGLDPEALRECMESDRQLIEVKQDIAEGVALDIRGTPSIWINGKQVPREQLNQIPAIIRKIIS